MIWSSIFFGLICKNFQIAAKPCAPAGPLIVKDVTAEKCTLEWKKPKDDGGVPVTEYEIEKMDLATGKWVRAGHKVKVGPDGETIEANITGLNPGSQYKFRVAAVNDEGTSDHLESERPTVAKNPYGKFLRHFKMARQKFYKSGAK